jgi:hypothetical protein
MIEKANEPIDVLVAFMKNKVMPLSFKWNMKKYSIDKVNMIYSGRVGRSKWYYFAVSCKSDFFKLGFNTENNKWFLEEASYQN